MSEEIEIKLFVESRDEKGGILPRARIIINGLEEGETNENGLFNGVIKASVGKDITLKAVKDSRRWETVFKIYPKIDEIKENKKKDGFEGDIRLEDEVFAIAEGSQKGEYRFIAILTRE